MVMDPEDNFEGGRAVQTLPDARTADANAMDRHETAADARSSPTVDKEKIDRQTSASPSIPTPDGLDASAHPVKPQVAAEADDAFAHLPDHERQILKKQLDAPAVQVNFFGLYRYADKWDLLIITISGISAIAAGSALPLFTVSSPAYFEFPAILIINTDLVRTIGSFIPGNLSPYPNI
jgi:hypothetical protein